MGCKSYCHMYLLFFSFHNEMKAGRLLLLFDGKWIELSIKDNRKHFDVAA